MENKPLAERLRPKTLDDYIGQQHLVGKGKVLRKMIESGVVSSFIFGSFHLSLTVLLLYRSSGSI